MPDGNIDSIVDMRPQILTHPANLIALADYLYRNDAINRKPKIYLDEYERLFQPMRNQPIRLFELGVHSGLSMQMWQHYFPVATVVGLDGEVKPAGFPSESRFHFMHGAQDDIDLLAKAVTAAGGPFDIIIDDASHLGCHTGRSFAWLFPNGLKPGGIYIIEDTCTAYTSGRGWDAAPFVSPKIGVAGMPKVFPSHQHGMIGLIKQLIDHAQAPTAVGGYTCYSIERMTVQTNFVVLHKAP